MLRLTSKPLPRAAQQHLDALQAQINAVATGWAGQASEAQRLWEAKNKNHFATIRHTLTGMAIGEGICHYCEQSEGYDIEHIQPKSHFPAQAFVWENYLLACPKCNQVDKLDKACVFDPAGSNHSIKLTRSAAPPTQDFALLNPRIENPMDYMALDFRTFLFKARISHVALGSRDFCKVENTVEILKLNDRRVLVENRKKAFGHFKRLLREYVGVKQAQSFAEIDDATSGDPLLNTSMPFADEQARVLDGLKNSILTSVHLTVWREMVRQRGALPLPIQNLFAQAPEVLTW
jgi:uncharacterized protein (TIGR02646 family)